MAVYIVTEDSVINARIAHDAMQARHAARVSRASKTRDYRKAHASQGMGCTCDRCISDRTRGSRKAVPADSIPVAPGRGVKTAKVGKMTKVEAAALRDYRAMKAAEVIWTDFQRGLH